MAGRAPPIVDVRADPRRRRPCAVRNTGRINGARGSRRCHGRIEPVRVSGLVILSTVRLGQRDLAGVAVPDARPPFGDHTRIALRPRCRA